MSLTLTLNSTYTTGGFPTFVMCIQGNTYARDRESETRQGSERKEKRVLGPMAAAEEEVLHELQAYLASVCPAVLGLEEGGGRLEKALEAPDARALLST